MDRIQRLIEQLRSPNKNKRYEACESLRFTPGLPQSALDALLQATFDPDREVAYAARRALAIQIRPDHSLAPGIQAAPAAPADAAVPQRARPRIPPKVPAFIFWVILMVVLIAVDMIDASYGLRESDVASYSNGTYTQVTFELMFGSGFWAEGRHEYMLAIDCPGSTNDRRATQSFQVSTAAPRHKYPVMLRAAGLRTRGIRAGLLNQFHPGDVSAAWVIVQLGLQQDAEACRVSVAWDGGLPEALSRVNSFSVLPGDDW